MRRLDDSLLIATHNAGKFEELTALLEPLGIRTVFARDLGLAEPDETGTTFIENARIKAHAAATATGLPALADDSGIEIDALGGAPGVYTADWAETPAGRDFVLAMHKAHKLLVESGASAPWTARFCCTLVLAWPDEEDAAFEGKVEGQVVWPMRGTQGHGYDPIFVPDGHDQTFAEMDRWEKNRMSHRAVALDKLVKALGA
ncbi:RdgB/HAM1 family non-canonical purine NTP pyrophosphatase [Palleronia sp. KMU-117]|uniref:RdgB/HAM1 family non-canonical purine NTP pyrophosphatase n=1 Tax=Palleronia sp. KMU-117 TaxID=3434108 RepID=UPI003D71D49A